MSFCATIEQKQTRMFKHLYNFVSRKSDKVLGFASSGLHSKPDFTKNNYRVQRGNFSFLEEDHLQFFRSVLGEKRVITDLSDLEKYNVDWLKYLRGRSTIVLKPKTTQEVSNILTFCDKNRLAVCPQGGHTGLVGGGTPIFDEIVISTELMNEIISLDEESGVLQCQAGCILQNLDNFLSEKKLQFPLDLGAKGTCQIGGNLSTNAGGLRVMKYGNLHGNVLGVEAVKANGEILDCLNTMKKDNTGYHLKHLFIGSEGTLGVITKVAIQCKKRPKSLNVAFLGLQNYNKVRDTFEKSKEDLNEILTSFEVMDSHTMELVNHNIGLQSPIGRYPFYILIETTGSDETHDGEKINRFLETCLKKNFILNGTVTKDPSKCKDIWEIRERITEGFGAEGYVFMYDVSLPLVHYYQLVEDMRKHMGNLAHRVFGFGHIGDGNLHLQISVRKYSNEIKEHIEPYVFHKTKEYNGSISAEHGIGFLKSKYLPLVKSPVAINTMRNLKRLMDPHGILNPYKIVA